MEDLRKNKVNEQQRLESKAQLIDSHRVSALLNVSSRTVWRLLSAGKLPTPIRVGGSVRWVLSEIEEWIGNGCPETPNDPRGIRTKP
jgi:prophage regulatory protein